jgi:hypothetical protein
MTDTIQTVHLADNINAAFDKINENFEGLTDGSIVVPPPSDISIGDLQDVTLTSLSNGEVLKWNGSSWTNLPDSGSGGGTNISTDSDLNQYITNLLDSSFFISVINQEYLEQFNITTDVTYTDSDVQANASAIFTLESRIDATDSGITVLSQAIIDTQASLQNITLGGIDSDLLADAIASANSTIISRIDANSDGITSFAGVIDSVENDMLLRDSATNDLIEINTTAISSLTSRINVNSDGLSVVVGDVTDLSLSLNQLISDGITLTPEQITEALGGALESLTLRLDADSDKLAIEAAKVVELETGLTAQESDLGAQITAVSNAQSSLISRTEFNTVEGTINTLTQDVVDLNNEISVTNPDGTLSTAIANAKSELTSSILATTDGDILAAVNGLETTLNAKIGTDIAAATSSLEAYVNAQGDTVATWGIDLVAGDSDNPKVAGIKFGNNGDTADFAITTDTFKILPADGTGSGTAPFSVVGGVVEMSGAKVTGDLDVTSSDTTGSMNIKGNLITISDGSGNPRVKLGKL